MKLDVLFIAESLNYTYIDITRSNAIFPIKVRLPDNFVMEIEQVLDKFRPGIINSGNLDSLDKWECFCINRFGASDFLSSGYVDLDLYVRLDLINPSLKYPSKKSLELLIDESLRDPIYSLEFFSPSFLESGEYLKSIGNRLKGKMEFKGVELNLSNLSSWDLNKNAGKFLSYIVDEKS
jgi:hypothetical protein